MENRLNISRTRLVVRIATALGLLLAGALLAACTNQAAASGESAAAAPQKKLSVPETPPTIELVAPAKTGVKAGVVTATVKTTGFKFAVPANTNVAGQGHVHFTLDDRPFVMSISPTVEIQNVRPGEHKLVAELVQNNTESFDPPIEAEITFVAQ